MVNSCTARTRLRSGSDDAGTAVPGDQGTQFWNDHIGAGRERHPDAVADERADVVVVRFGAIGPAWSVKRRGVRRRAAPS
jgi:hypothetical protein